ncbi:MAG: sugar phosphate nucleotidyltransferase [Luteolibacter sp.]
MTQAFLLGAGLGTRLRPLTDRLPKPLVPLFHRPLAEWAMRACAANGITRFAINTHHLPEAWENFRPEGISDITLFHEPILLETGGGLKNIASWIGNESVLVHNGDIFSTLPLDRLIAAHQASGLPVTLALRSTGTAKHIAINETKNRVTDIRNTLGNGEGTHVFSGIYCVNPEFLELIPAYEKIPVILAFLELAKAGKLGAIVLDEGVWLDLGDRASYLQAHRELALDTPIHPTATIGEGARIENSIIGPDCTIAPGSTISHSVLWPGSNVTADANLENCIVFSPNSISGTHRDEDL